MSSLLHLQPTSYTSRGNYKISTDPMVHHKIGNDMKERVLYLLLEAGWEIERIAEALGDGKRTMLYMDVWSLSNQSTDILGCWQVIWLTIYNCYYTNIPPFFLMRSGNGLLSTTTSPFHLQHCTWIYGILPSCTNASSRLQLNVTMPIDFEYDHKWHSGPAGVSQQIQQRWMHSAVKAQLCL